MASKGNVRRRADTGKYEVNWRDGTGRRRWATFDRKKDAEMYLRQGQVEADAVRESERRTKGHFVSLGEYGRARLLRFMCLSRLGGVSRGPSPCGDDSA